MRRITALVMVALLSGCAEEPSSPQETFDAFLRAWYFDDHEAAWEMIAPQDRERLAAPRAELEAAGVSPLPAPRELLLVRSITNPYAVKKVELAEALPAPLEVGAEAKLVLELRDGQKSEASLEWSGERWFVRMPGPAAAPPGSERGS